MHIACSAVAHAHAKKTPVSAGWRAKSIGTNLCYFCASFPFSNCGRFSSVGRALDYRVGGRGFDSRGLTNTQGSENIYIDTQIKCFFLI